MRGGLGGDLAAGGRLAERVLLVAAGPGYAAQQAVVGVLDPAFADFVSGLEARVALILHLFFGDLPDRAEHVRGPAKMYSRACFQAIGGLEAVRGRDMIDETKAQMAGFETRSFIEDELIHLRPIDGRQEKVLRSRYEMGRLYWYLGYHWLYHAIRSARSVLQDYPRPAECDVYVAGPAHDAHAAEFQLLERGLPRAQLHVSALD